MSRFSSFFLTLVQKKENYCVQLHAVKLNLLRLKACCLSPGTTKRYLMRRQECKLISSQFHYSSTTLRVCVLRQYHQPLVKSVFWDIFICFYSVLRNILKARYCYCIVLYQERLNHFILLYTIEFLALNITQQKIMDTPCTVHCTVRSLSDDRNSY